MVRVIKFVHKATRRSATYPFWMSHNNTGSTIVLSRSCSLCLTWVKSLGWFASARLCLLTTLTTFPFYAVIWLFSFLYSCILIFSLLYTNSLVFWHVYSIGFFQKDLLDLNKYLIHSFTINQGLFDLPVATLKLLQLRHC